MQTHVKRSVDRQLTALTDAGFQAAAVLLSRDMYTALLQELAMQRASDDVDPIGVYEGVLVAIAPGEKVVAVVPNAEVHWHNAGEIDAVNTPVERKPVVRFTEL